MSPAAASSTLVSHNLPGQRLGRKGRDTRERIRAAADAVRARAAEPVSLSAVAHEASLGMTTLDLYFGDWTELLPALLDRITAGAAASHVAHLPDR